MDKSRSMRNFWMLRGGYLTVMNYANFRIMSKRAWTYAGFRITDRRKRAMTAIFESYAKRVGDICDMRVKIEKHGLFLWIITASLEVDNKYVLEAEVASFTCMRAIKKILITTFEKALDYLSEQRKAQKLGEYVDQIFVHVRSLPDPQDQEED